MGFAKELSGSLAALVLTLLPIAAQAQTPGGVIMEQVMGTDGEARELKLHPPSLPPPTSTLKPLIELMSTYAKSESSEAFVKPYATNHIDVLTYHYENLRSGWNPNEVELKPNTVASDRFSLITTLDVDGNVFAQPLLVSGFKIKDGKDHDVLVVATGKNLVYAFDANTYEKLWPNPISLGPPQKTADVGCADVKPEYGISSTPVIVRKTKDSATLYVVSATQPNKNDFHTFIHALDLTTGKDRYPPTEIAPTGKYSDGSVLKFDSQNQWSRAGLAYNSGSVIVSVGTHCDNTSLSGWVLKFSESLELQASLNTIKAPKTEGDYQHGLASVWMTGFAPAIDEAGNLFVVTGNGDFSPTDGDYAESVLRIKGDTLTVDDYFTPETWVDLNKDDLDFGSGGVVLFSADVGAVKKDFAAVIGKAEYHKDHPIFYVLDKENLGKKQQNNAGTVQALSLPDCPVQLPHKQCRGGVYGGPAVFKSENKAVLFVQAEQDVLRSYEFDGPTSKLKPSGVVGTTKGGYGGSIPIVSSDGDKNALVWLIRRSAPIELEVYDALQLGEPLCSALIGDWSNPKYGVSGNSFLTPMVANGRVYAPGHDVVRVFGLAAAGVETKSSACISSKLASR